MIYRYANLVDVSHTHILNSHTQHSRHEDKKELNYSPHVPKGNHHPHYLSHGHTRVSTLVIYSKS